MQECELALVAAKEECSSYEKRSQDLEQRLLRTQNNAQELQNGMESFFKEVQILLGYESVVSQPEEDHILERLREVCRREKSSTEVALTLAMKVHILSFFLACWLSFNFK